MRKRLASMFFVGAAAAAAVAIAAPSAFASGGTWTVSPGGSFTSSLNSGTSAVLSDSSNGLSLSCTASTASGSLKTPPAGSAVLGAITSIKWSNCSGLGGLAAGSATGNASASNPWTLTGAAYNASVDGGQTTGKITAPGTGVGATLSLTVLGSPCTAVVGGTTSAPATSTGLYDNTSGLLAATSTTNLKVISSNCTGLTAGNTATFFTSPASTAGTAVSHGYTVSPKQKITDP
ncbi:MAG: hypothetical protein JOY82_17135 [Streptosporangiaceae bacterium]|nr:hypothetical protein [Streptosporangiaceae bacterium]MBV9856217.1 hypothetical protein [Streptosporangiaceae bacterium]